MLAGRAMYNDEHILKYSPEVGRVNEKVLAGLQTFIAVFKSD